MRCRRLLLLGLLLGFAPSAWAYDLALTQAVRLSDTQFEVRVGWRGSWWFEGGDTPAQPANHDAVWLFGKYQDADGRWQHLDLGTESSGFTPGIHLTAVAVADGKGVWLRRATPGAGDIAPEAVVITLPTPPDADWQALHWFALEMVFVPEGPFWVGDSLSQFTLRRGADAGPFHVVSEDVLPVGEGAAQLFGGTARFPMTDVPAAFPKGFAGFYAMKYELTQGAYADFLNTLTFAQQATRTAALPDAAVGTAALNPTQAPLRRNGIVIATPGQAGGAPARYALDGNGNGTFDEADDGTARACNFLGWADVAAFLDWAALRPLTETELEKLCRGSWRPQPKAFAWQTPYFVNANTPVADGTLAETVSEVANDTAGLGHSGGLFGQDFLMGPLRGGFGGDTTNHRLRAGAAYYGAMEVSGNVWEAVVALFAEGLAFDGTPGDGALSPDGQANAPTWPPATGALWRGGAWNSLLSQDLNYPFRDLAVSDRFYSNLAPNPRLNTTGGRGGRSLDP